MASVLKRLGVATGTIPDLVGGATGGVVRALCARLLERVGIGICNLRGMHYISDRVLVQSKCVSIVLCNMLRVGTRDFLLLSFFYRRFGMLQLEHLRRHDLRVPS